MGALSIGLGGTVGSASPNDDYHSDKGPSTLTVLTKTREARVVDLAAQGTSQGDMRVLNAPLYNESAKEKVGHFDVFCVLTNPDEKVEITQCVAMYALSDGEIRTQGVTAYPKLSKIPSRVVDAVSGDTGATLVCGAS